MSAAVRQTSKKGEHSTHLINPQEAEAKMARMLVKEPEPQVLERAKEILKRILTKNARVYELDKASAGLHAVCVYLACEELRNLPGKRMTQKECQLMSDLGPKLFRRSVDLCRHAKDLDETKINFAALVEQFGGSAALRYMEPMYLHFKESCFGAKIVDATTWNANHILVVCALYCWTVDHVYPYPVYKGPDVAFRCGLGWENVQKSMYFNLNPHCTDKMRQLLAQDAIDGVGPVIPPPVGPPPTQDDPSNIPKPAHYPQYSTAAYTSVTPAVAPRDRDTVAVKTERESLPPVMAPRQENPLRKWETSPPRSYDAFQAQLAASKVHRPSASTSSSYFTSAPPPPSNLPSKRAPPVEIDLTMSDDEPDSGGPSTSIDADMLDGTMGAGGRSRRKNAGKRKIDGEEVGTQSSRKPASSSKRPVVRTEPLSTDAEWEAKDDKQLFMKVPNESKSSAEMRVYYAWKRFMVDFSQGDEVRGLKELEGREVKDFVIT